MAASPLSTLTKPKSQEMGGSRMRPIGGTFEEDYSIRESQQGSNSLESTETEVRFESSGSIDFNQKTESSENFTYTPSIANEDPNNASVFRENEWVSLDSSNPLNIAGSFLDIVTEKTSNVTDNVAKAMPGALKETWGALGGLVTEEILGLDVDKKEEPKLSPEEEQKKAEHIWRIKKSQEIINTPRHKISINTVALHGGKVVSVEEFKDLLGLQGGFELLTDSGEASDYHVSQAESALSDREKRANAKQNALIISTGKRQIVSTNNNEAPEGKSATNSLKVG